MIRNVLVKIVVNGLALWLAALAIAGITIGRAGDLPQTVKTVLIVAVVFGLVNAVIKPVLKFFSTPLIWLTLGLFTLVINAAMLELTSWLSDRLGLDFRVEHFFWDAILGAVIVTIVSMLLHAVIPDRDARRRGARR